MAHNFRELLSQMHAVSGAEFPGLKMHIRVAKCYGYDGNILLKKGSGENVWHLGHLGKLIESHSEDRKAQYHNNKQQIG